MKIDNDLLLKALQKWGERQQINMIKEECLELALALQKLERNGDIDEKYRAIIDEIADVIIMMEQAKIIFSINDIQERIDFKMKRLEETLKK
jgi:NTP pyrophosphatase (non-canonical NTP hydrolase)